MTVETGQTRTLQRTISKRRLLVADHYMSTKLLHNNQTLTLNLSSFEKTALLIAVILLYLLTFFQYSQTGYTTRDDTLTALRAMNLENYLDEPLRTAKSQGRLSQVFNSYLDGVPYLIDSEVYYQLIKLGALVINFILFQLVLREYFNIKFAYFGVALALAVLPNNWHHNLLTSYPFASHFGVSSFFLSLIILKRYLKTGEKWLGVLMGVSYFFSLCVTELYAFYGILLILICNQFVRKQPLPIFQRTRTLLNRCLPFLIPAILFVVGQMLFQLVYPGHYSGTRLDNFSPIQSLLVIAKLVLGNFPGASFFAESCTIERLFDGFEPYYSGIKSLVLNLKSVWVVKALLVCSICYYGLTKPRASISLNNFIRITCFVLTAWFLTFLPYSMVVKYKHLVLEKDVYFYLPSYYTFFFTILFLASLSFFLFSRVKNALISKAGMAMFLSFLFMLSISIDFSNYYIAQDQKLSHLKWKAFDAFMTTQYFKAIPANSTIIAPTLWQYRGIVKPTPSYWAKYVRKKSEKSLKVVKDVPHTFGRNNYYFSFVQEQKSPNQYMILAQLPENSSKIVSREYVLFSMSKYRQFNIVGKMVSGSETHKVVVSADSQSTVIVGKDYYRIFLDYIVNPRDQRSQKRTSSESFFRRIRERLSKSYPPKSALTENSLYIVQIKGSSLFNLQETYVSYFKCHLSEGLIYR